MRELIQKRTAGDSISRHVVLMVGDYQQDKWWRWQETERHACYVLKRSHDLRAVKGLDVTLMAQSYTAEVAHYYAALKEYACWLMLWVEEWDDEMLVWDGKQETTL